MLYDILIEASAMALMAAAFSVILRSTGVFMLEVTVFGLGVALGLTCMIGPQSTGAPNPLWFLMCGGVSFFLGFALLRFYRLCRAARGGDATTLIMSFALMTGLSIATSRLTEGKSVMVGPGISDNPLAVAAIGWLCLGILLALWGSPRLRASLALARDNDALLSTFAVTGGAVRVVAVIVSSALLLVGTLIYVSQQDNFAAARYESYLIPVFAIVISQATFRIGHLVALSLCLASLDRVLRLEGEPVLLRAYQSAFLVSAVLLMPVIYSISDRLAEIKWRLRRAR